MNKSNPELLSALQALETAIGSFDPEDVYNKDEAGLFFCLLPRYTLLLSDEDIRGKKKSKERVTMVVCTNTAESHTSSCTMMGKSRAPTSLLVSIAYSHIIVEKPG